MKKYIFSFVTVFGFMSYCGAQAQNDVLLTTPNYTMKQEVHFSDVKKQVQENEEFHLKDVNWSFVLVQERKEKRDTKLANNHIFIELLGSGGVYSVNYERIFTNNFTTRFGISYLPEIDLGSYVTIGSGVRIPMTLNYLMSLNEGLKIEGGAGFTFKHTEKGMWNYLTGFLGFRHFDSKGTIVRLGMVPIYELRINKQNFSIGFSIGKQF